eukprot:2924877-Amphidinium_carterae.1
MHSLVVDAYIVRKNVAFKAYAAQYPDRIPPDDAGWLALSFLASALNCQHHARLEYTARDDCTNSCTSARAHTHTHVFATANGRIPRKRV